jgi:hypothetical protein
MAVLKNLSAVFIVNKDILGKDRKRIVTCDSMYIGKTKRSLKIRFDKHIDASFDPFRMHIYTNTLTTS